jgi:hypothetical protein
MSLSKLLIDKPVVVVSHAGPQFIGRMGRIVDLHPGLMADVDFYDGMYHNTCRISVRGLRAPEQVDAKKRVKVNADIHPSHQLYTEKDFTDKEINYGNVIANAVLRHRHSVCKRCGCSNAIEYFEYKNGDSAWLTRPCGDKRKARRKRQGMQS